MTTNGSTKTTKIIPNLENATPSFLVDEIAKLRLEANRIKFLDGIYKNALRARASEQQLNGNEQIEGTEFIGSYENVTQERIDSDAVRAHFANDPEGLRKVMKIIEFPQFSTKPRVG
jgi:hypothetical protein